MYREEGHKTPEGYVTLRSPLTAQAGRRTRLTSLSLPGAGRRRVIPRPGAMRIAAPRYAGAGAGR